MQRAEKEFLDFQKMKTAFRHQSGRHWPDLDDTLGFKSWSPGAHFGPIPGPWGPQKNHEKIKKLLGKLIFLRISFSVLAISAYPALRHLQRAP